jgi:hypothetical protein
MNHVIASFCLAVLLVGCAGTSVGVSGNSDSVSASVGVPVGSAIVTATGQINPQDPSQWEAGIVVVFKSPPSAESLTALASANAVVANNDNQKFFIAQARSLIKADAVTAAVTACLHDGASIYTITKI